MKKNFFSPLWLLLAASIVGAGFVVYARYQDYLWYKKTNAFMAALEKPFKEDVYGGKTPEETWAMYVEAVKKRDVDLASKYVDVNHQGKERDFLADEMKIDNLNLYILQLSHPLQKNTNLEDFVLADKTRAYYFYQFKSSKQIGKVITHDVNFYLNPLTKVWKILY